MPCPKITSALFSKTAASTERFIKTRVADFQLPQSPASIRRRFRNKPSPQAKPVNLPLRRKNSATKRATSVVPMDPVMPTSGMRPLSPLGNK